LFKSLYVDDPAPLLTIYDYNNKEQLILSLGRDIDIFYGIDSNDEKVSISFGVDISDNEWHRFGISIKGDSVTIILDCDRHITKELQRNQEKMITGIVMIRQQLNSGLYLVSKKSYDSVKSKLNFGFVKMKNIDKVFILYNLILLFYLNREVSRC